jgi:hypothetical protein
MKKIFWALAFAIVSGLAINAEAQCPMCKQNIQTARKAGNNSVGNGLNDGILYLLAAPYLLGSLVAIGWYRAYKKSRKALPS